MDWIMKRLWFVPLVVLAIAVIWVGWRFHTYEVEAAELRNAVAARDVTIETSKGVYEKLALQVRDVSELLDRKDQQIAALLKQVKQGHQDLAAAGALVIKWKRAYEGLAEAHQTEQPPVADGPIRRRVEFAKDFGYIGVTGYTVTDPAEAWVSVRQLRPLKVAVAIAQDKAKAWHAYATSSEENVEIDISSVGVSPYVTGPHWYERISLGFDAGVSVDGPLVGLRAEYQVGSISFGPAVWSAGGKRYFGASLQWRPFLR